MSNPDPDFLSRLDSLPPLRDVISAHALRAQKALGQNFLLDQNITDKIVRSAGSLGSVNCIEIGPGPGGLTRSILRAGPRSLTAIEFDPRAIGALADLERAAEGRLRLIQGDALACDLMGLVAPPRAVLANLPYNIATPLLLGWLQQWHKDPQAFESLTLMFQKEVAQRIAAAPGSPAYGRLSVVSQWICGVKKVYDLPPAAFTPPPKVSSSVVHFTPRIRPADDPAFETLEAITAAAFGQRRKMIRSSLAAYAPMMEGLGWDVTRRAETLAVTDFIALARAVEAQGGPRGS